MQHFIATYRYADGSDARRDEVRATHRDYLDGLDALLLGGPTQAETGAGAVLVFAAESVAAVERMLDEDPFTTAGVVAERSIAPWIIGVGRAREAMRLKTS